MEEKPKANRRELLVKLGIGGGIAALAGQAVASLRSLVPNVSYDAPTTVKVGMPNDFPDGMKFLPVERLFVFRDGNVFHAVSAVCTHLGCTVRAEALSQPETRTVEGKPLGSRTGFSAPATARSTTATGPTSRGRPRGRSPGTTSRSLPRTGSSSWIWPGPWIATSA